MIIKKLLLKGYKRVMLSGIDEIIIEPESLYQCILGTNGSGKSSIMSEWSLLPGNPSDFVKDGKKEVMALVGGVTYLATSVYSGGSGKHTLIKYETGLETVINDNVTITVQRETIESLFGLNEFVMRLLLGKVKFTQMSNNERRTLITQLSSDDLTFATKIHKKAATATRDLQGTLKYLKERLATETEKLNSLAVSDDIEQTVNQLQTELTLLMSEKQNGGVSPNTLKQLLDSKQSRLEWLLERIRNNAFKDANVKGYKSPEEIISDKMRLQGTLTANESHIKTLADEYNKYASLLATFVKTDDIDVDTINHSLPLAIAEVESLKQQVKQFTFTGNLEYTVNEAQEFKAKLLDVLMALPDNSEKLLSRPELEAAKVKFDKLGETLYATERTISRLEENINHIEKMDDVNCPDCGYTWKPGVNKHDLDKYKADLLVSLENRDKLRIARTETSDKILAIEDYLSKLVVLKRLFDVYPKASNLYDWLLEEKRFLYKPSTLTYIVDTWLRDLNTQFKIQTLESNISWMESALKAATLNAEQSKEHVQSRLNEIERNIDSLSAVNADIQKEISQLTVLHKDAVDVVNWSNELKNVLEEQALAYDAYVRSEKESHINELIRAYQTQLALQVSKLNQRKAIVDVISDLTKSLESVTENYAINKKLTETLSPVDGLIAKQMLQFITVFVDQINAVINNVWSLPLNVKPCGTEDSGLSYRFPLVSGDDAVITPDVKEGSDGQCVIVDFAFRLVCIMYMGLNNFPLYLDEPGREFDEQHMTSLMNYVKMLMDNNEHSQLVIISHIAVSHGAFNGADVCVLNGLNISAPAGHNRHVTIK